MSTRRTTTVTRWEGRLAVILVLSGCAASIALAQLPLPPDHPRRTLVNKAFNLRQFQVAEGTEAKAKGYYQNTVSPRMKFLNDVPSKILTSNLQDLLKYFGYNNIRPSELHALSSDAIMAKSPVPGDILATRFFAPKITRVSDPPKMPPDGGFGWRKLVRFKARPGSAGDAQGIGALLFLQNSFEKTGTADPFDPDKNVAFFNQAMAVRAKPPVDTDQHQAMYFFTYGIIELAFVSCGTGFIIWIC